MSRKTIKLPEDDYHHHNWQRKRMGLTWSEYIDGKSPDLEGILREVIREELESQNV